MRKWVALAAGVVLGVFVWVLFIHKTPSGTPPSIEQQNAVVNRALARQDTNTVSVIESNFARIHVPPANPLAGAVDIHIPPAGPPAPLQFTNFEPETVLQNMARAIRQYGEMFGGNPVGDNQEITSELSGKNPRHINFITAEAGMRINADGELVDPWGTPYFFHQLSGSDTEVHSAGPDRVMWTSDDIVVQSER